MKHKKLRFPLLFLIAFLISVSAGNSFAQTRGNNTEVFEDIYAHWFSALDKAKANAGISATDFDVFTRFSQKAIDSVRGDFMNKIGSGKVTVANVKDYENVLADAIMTVYKRFEAIKEHYPSSVEEYKHYKPLLSQTCDSACNNIDFESGNLSGWYAYYGVNESNTSFNINNVTGGLAGAVTHAANDPLTSTSGFYVPVTNGCFGPNPTPDYQINITSGTRGDALVPAIPVVSPFGGSYSVMLGDSSQINYGAAILSQTFKVSASNANFTYQYAVFLANPNHTYYHQPFFRVAVLDESGDTIPFCGEYSVVSGNGTQSFDSIQYTDNFACETFVVYYKNWTIVNVPLTKYIGQCVTVVFEVADCAQGGHFGYAYVDASCAPLAVISSSDNFCGQDSLTLTGPAGESVYQWTGPSGGIKGSDTSRIINVDSAGTYTLVVTPFTGATCNDTLTIKIGKKLGPPPAPDFSADTVCVGTATKFTNTSNPSGGSFYWDFYNVGNYQDSSANPTWVYNIPGVYTVKLHEVVNGCGMDTLIKVVVDSIVNPSFISDTVCAFDTIYFTNTSTGAHSYVWNFGDTASGSRNTSTVVNPNHVYGSPGDYTVTLTGINTGECADSIKEKVVVLKNVALKVTATDSICSGDIAVFTASGGGTYLWSTGSTKSSITVNPSATTTYSVKVSNGKCFLDTVFTLVVKPIGTGSVYGTGTICFGDTIVLSATGGGRYLWSNGATTSTISVPANSFSDTAYSVIISNGDSCLTLSKRINIDSITGFACCTDTIYAGNSTVLQGYGSTSYYWVPSTGLSCDTCPDPTASPTVTTTYTLISTTIAGCSATSYMTVNVEIPCKDFFIPNVFTPNGDKSNDTYLIKVEYMSQYEISIYNRWGKEVFHSTNPDSPWDGNIDGSAASQGVYYYIVRSTCFDGNSFEKHGFLQLIR
jgi:gliding motility-associated-like protein